LVVSSKLDAGESISLVDAPSRVGYSNRLPAGECL